MMRYTNRCIQHFTYFTPTFVGHCSVEQSEHLWPCSLQRSLDTDGGDLAIVFHVVADRWSFSEWRTLDGWRIRHDTI